MAQEIPNDKSKILQLLREYYDSGQLTLKEKTSFEGKIKPFNNLLHFIRKAKRRRPKFDYPNQ